MQSFRMLSAIAAGAVLVSGAAYGQSAPYRGEARLVSATSAPREDINAGVAWRCEGDACVGTEARKGNLEGLVRECKKVVAVVGAVAAYRSGGRALDDGQLRAFNAGALKLQTARN